MSRTSILATLALCAIAGVAGGAVVRLGGLVGNTAAVLTLVFVGAVVVIGLGNGLSARPTASTTYWW